MGGSLLISPPRPQYHILSRLVVLFFLPPSFLPFLPSLFLGAPPCTYYFRTLAALPYKISYQLAVFTKINVQQSCTCKDLELRHRIWGQSRATLFLLLTRPPRFPPSFSFSLLYTISIKFYGGGLVVLNRLYIIFDNSYGQMV